MKGNGRKLRVSEEERFTQGFGDSIKLDEEEARLGSLSKKGERSASIKKIRRLENQITPASRMAAIISYRPIIAECRRYFEAHGKPENIQDLIDALKQKGILERTYRAGGTIFRSDRAVRDFLHRQFGIDGRPGRKPRKLPTSPG